MSTIDQPLSGAASAEDIKVGAAPAAGTENVVNEIVKSATLAKEGEEAAEAGKNADSNRNAWIAAGVGIGSAALVAALLYANNRGRNRKKD